MLSGNLQDCRPPSTRVKPNPHHFQSKEASSEQNEGEAYRFSAYVQLTAKIVQVPLLKWMPPSPVSQPQTPSGPYPTELGDKERKCLNRLATDFIKEVSHKELKPAYETVLFQQPITVFRDLVHWNVVLEFQTQEGCLFTVTDSMDPVVSEAELFTGTNRGIVDFSINHDLSIRMDLTRCAWNEKLADRILTFQAGGSFTGRYAPDTPEFESTSDSDYSFWKALRSSDTDGSLPTGVFFDLANKHHALGAREAFGLYSTENSVDPLGYVAKSAHKLEGERHFGQNEWLKNTKTGNSVLSTESYSSCLP